MGDALSDALQAVKLTGAVFMTMDFRAPWCVLTNEAPLRRAMPRVEHMIHFHYVQQGQCHVRIPDTGQRMVVHEGEVVLIAHGDAHELSSDPALAPTPIESLLTPGGGRPLTQLKHGGNGAATLVVCGFLACDPRLCRSLLQALPRLTTVALRSGPSGGWIEATVQQSLLEADSGRAGAVAMLARLSELLFVEALRRHVETLGPDQPGWLAGLRDPLVGRALALLHNQPERKWTVENLARETGGSRSVLSERFAHYLGVAPMRYLTRWRLALAARTLRNEPGARLARVAEAVGYDSETAFNRAFKREHGHSPQRWRRQVAG
jgi:AraC family transcriptional regulator, alkane utilization regulator